MSVLRWLDANLEKSIMFVNYVAMAGIIFVEVLRRFFFQAQSSWSSTIPIYLFLWIVWIGCAYNVKIRAHLSFDELRSRLSRRGQYLCLVLDGILWIVFATIVIFYSVEQVRLSRDNFSIVPGTDDIMQWWFYLATPVAFSLLIFRVLQNMVQDYKRFQSGADLQIQTSVYGD